MTFHLLFITIQIAKRRKSAAEVQHEQRVQERMDALKERQTAYCRLF
ncbi:YrzI family small protein [Ectobacillus ponti]|uniref:YrzI family small protein n=1 Tax=Ectobacillus ponti TaxID=2961894 RepID=A0AA42BPF8_9BACI|nr:YrzI family small protein [Ectobacillus ponti]MCP8968381.1 YrzI family small protein [Ectobacillus ponti]